MAGKQSWRIGVAMAVLASLGGCSTVRSNPPAENEIPPDVRVVMEQRVSLGENGCKTECALRLGSDARALRECHEWCHCIYHQANGNSALVPTAHDVFSCTRDWLDKIARH